MALADRVVALWEGKAFGKREQAAAGRGTSKAPCPCGKSGMNSLHRSIAPVSAVSFAASVEVEPNPMVCPLCGQDPIPNTAPQFDVAVIKPTADFDMEGKAGRSCTADELHRMLHHLLEERFQIKIHRDMLARGSVDRRGNSVYRDPLQLVWGLRRQLCRQRVPNLTPHLQCILARAGRQHTLCIFSGPDIVAVKPVPQPKTLTIHRSDLSNRELKSVATLQVRVRCASRIRTTDIAGSVTTLLP